MNPEELEDIEIRLLLGGVREVYGYDFFGYAEASLKRRIRQWLSTSGFPNLSVAQASLLRDAALFELFLRSLTVNVTEMFRDPLFFKSLREQVLPFLATYPFIKIWNAGCATGEEAYSMAILLHEAGLAGRYRIYATDINEAVLQKAREGVFRLADFQNFTRSYQKSGGQGEFSNYYMARYERALLMPELKQDIVFASHNLAADVEFGEMNLILCRNVMIYFKPALKERCLELFNRSLVPGGFLCLGTKEVLDGRAIAPKYSEVVAGQRIYRKRYD